MGLPNIWSATLATAILAAAVCQAYNFDGNGCCICLHIDTVGVRVVGEVIPLVLQLFLDERTKKADP